MTDVVYVLLLFCVSEKSTYWKSFYFAHIEKKKKGFWTCYQDSRIHLSLNVMWCNFGENYWTVGREWEKGKNCVLVWSVFPHLAWTFKCCQGHQWTVAGDVPVLVWLERVCQMDKLCYCCASDACVQVY